MDRAKIFYPLFLIITVLSMGFVNPISAADHCKAVYGEGQTQFTLATGSPGELGLVEKIADVFNKNHGTQLCWVKAGSGKSLKLLKEKKVDVIMVHAPAAEKQAVQEGWAIKRNLLGSNEFYIVGPHDDPAGVANAKSAHDAYAKIESVKATFLTRADNSGTHKKELSIWKKAGVEPSGDWYVKTNTFMKATLLKADVVKGYFMTDSSTWVATKKELKNLRILFKGDPYLVNTYHALCQPANTTPGQPMAAAFIDFLVSEEGQDLFQSYGTDLYGEGLYNDAAYAKKYGH